MVAQWFRFVAHQTLAKMRHHIALNFTMELMLKQKLSEFLLGSLLFVSFRRP